MSPPVRVIFDTNVYVQTMLNKSGIAGQCFDHALAGSIQLFVSRNILAEFRTVIRRPTFSRFLPDLTVDEIEAFITAIGEVAEIIRVPSGSVEIVRDAKDNMILELAELCGPNFIVSWDRDLLDLTTGFDTASKEFRQRFRHLTIVRPNEFLKIISETGLTLAP